MSVKSILLFGISVLILTIVQNSLQLEFNVYIYLTLALVLGAVKNIAPMLYVLRGHKNSVNHTYRKSYQGKSAYIYRPTYNSIVA